MIERDDKIRVSALDPQDSFIIQAPAGSGKTELLVQRCLVLLAKAVHSPEEIIAITFTRKAAAEMRERILTALKSAQAPEPNEPHKKITWRLAREALTTDHARDWQLLKNPNRLRILTIDALSAMLSAQMPLLSGFGAKPTLSEDASLYYQQSVVETLNKPYDHIDAVKTLLLHFDNDAEKLTELLCQLLAKREQWLPHLIPHRANPDRLKAYLEQSLTHAVSNTLERAREEFPVLLTHELTELASFAASMLLAENVTHPLTTCANLLSLPECSVENKACWLGISTLLLTKEGQWRKTLDKRVGFPPQHKALKERALLLLKKLNEYDTLRQALVEVMELPPAQYNDQQWRVITALLALLPRLTAELNLQFQAHGVIDFVELSLGALRALSDQDAPTDLALYLDYQIRHLLVDEFQDTSVIQFNLLEQLTREWQYDDGKTLFLVGDPMQSIYRFRNAEVGLFLKAQQQGIGDWPLTSLQLTQNFRSCAALVKWINSTFQTILPKQANLSLGAVPYSPSHAIDSTHDEAAVYYYAFTQKMVETIAELQQQYPNDTCAILVRSRSQLTQILAQLTEANLRYEAVDLDPLDQRPEISDLLALTRALSHVADRIAWLAVLRAPWAGLALTDLHAICQAAGAKPILYTLQNYVTIPNLSTEGQTRLAHIIPILIESSQQQGRVAYVDWIKNAWYALKGNYGLDEKALSNVKSFFDLLVDMDDEFSLDLLTEKVKKLFAQSSRDSTSQLKIMTIHKSKGLEFDHVFIPELQRGTPADASALLLWQESPNSYGDPDLILAPIKASSEIDDPIHRYLKRREQIKLEHEVARLLYVATTRARKTLHLGARLDIDDTTGEFTPPSKGTFLHLLWSSYQHEFMQQYTATAEPITEMQTQKRLLKRLKTEDLTQKLLDSDDYTHYFHLQPRLNSLLEQYQQSSFGTVLHELIERLSQHNDNATELLHHAKRRLRQFHFDTQTTETMLAQLNTALTVMQTDTRGQWILKQHQNAMCEYRLFTRTEDEFQQHVLDRCFIDEHDVCWIIDYKSAKPRGEPLDEFLLQQKGHHQAQLHRYAELMRTLHHGPIKLGLYFPLCGGFIEWDREIASVEKIGGLRTAS